ncbi:MAG: phage tail assembly protein [Magnetococcales bacterium]|nr:phage tail assembly protein [Magnetococcales bacterium]
MDNRDKNSINLEYPIVVHGVELKSLTMRRPKVRDQLAVETAGVESERELTLFANLCDQTPETIKDLDLKDYAALQKLFTGFLS